MARDDSILNSGISSASFGSTKAEKVAAAKRQEKTDEKKEKKQQLKPSAKLIKDEIDKELALIRDMTTVNVDVPADDLKAELMGRQIARERLVAFKTRLLNVMRDSKNG